MDVGYVSHARAIEDAMRAFIDVDDMAEIERRIDDILDTLPSNDGAKKTDCDSLEGHVVSGPTRQVKERINTDLKQTFARVAREELNTRPGEALGYALQEHCDTGGRNRSQRIHDKLDAIEVAIESSNASNKQKKVAAITEDLRDEFLLSEFLDAAEAVGVSTEKYAIERFLLDVLDRSGTVPHPEKPRLFIPRSRAYAPKNSNPANLPYYALADVEKRVGVQVAAIRKAWSSSGRARLTVAEGVDALAGVGSPKHKTVRAAMRDAEKQGDGFEFDSSKMALTVNIDEIDRSSEEWAIAAEERARKNGDQVAGDVRESDATAEMDRITRGTPVADGGGEV